MQSLLDQITCKCKVFPHNHSPANPPVKCKMFLRRCSLARLNTPPALPRALPSYGACGSARTHTRTSPQHRSAPRSITGDLATPRQASCPRLHCAISSRKLYRARTVRWRVWLRAHPHPYQPATQFAPRLCRQPGYAQAGKPHAPAMRDLIPPALPRAHRPLARMVARAVELAG